MPRHATGQVVEHKGKDGRVYRSLRYRFGGARRTMPLGVVSRAEAEAKLAHTIADVERGLDPARIETPDVQVVDVPTFHEYAEQWWLLNESELAENTRADYRWRLEKHLLGHFGTMRLDQITIAEVDRYVASKRDGTPLPQVDQYAGHAAGRDPRPGGRTRGDREQPGTG